MKVEVPVKLKCPKDMTGSRLGVLKWNWYREFAFPSCKYLFLCWSLPKMAWRYCHFFTGWCYCLGSSSIPETMFSLGCLKFQSSHGNQGIHFNICQNADLMSAMFWQAGSFSLQFHFAFLANFCTLRQLYITHWANCIHLSLQEAILWIHAS